MNWRQKEFNSPEADFGSGSLEAGMLLQRLGIQMIAMRIYHYFQ